MFNSRASSSAAIKRLTIEYKQLSTDPNSLFPAVGPISEDNYLEWEALVPGPDGTPFEGGVFSARLSFPASYPLEPPTMRFEPPIFHPNVYADGLVCISILHAPGDDPNMYESSSERWSPVQSIEKILLSVLSMLAEPNVESGANIDACVSDTVSTLLSFQPWKNTADPVSPHSCSAEDVQGRPRRLRKDHSRFRQGAARPLSSKTSA